jgi:hypothetical protein
MSSSSSDSSSDSDEENEAIQAVYALEHADSTREAYQGRLRLFVNYLRRTDPELVLDDDTFDVKQLSLKQFELYLLHKQDDERVSYAVLKVRPICPVIRPISYFPFLP